MQRQRELLERSRLDLKPQVGRTQPRFWVRRVVIWSEPGAILREISLQPGLNIIWSPDPADSANSATGDNGLGHGGGKSLFCRLLRYCLGEDHFVPGEQRHLVAQALPNGLVGAEVIVDGTQWAILRPIGNRRQHFSSANTRLEELAAGNIDANGIEPFLQALESALFPNDLVALMPTDKPSQAWLVALAWLSRDQECSFHHVLDWRSPTSDSDSPARGLSVASRLDALRTLIAAIVPDEYRLRGEIEGLEAGQKDAIQDASRRAWEADRLRSWLTRELALNPADLLPGGLAIEPMRGAAKARLARLADVQEGHDVADFGVLRNSLDDAQKQADDLALRKAELEARIPEIKALIGRIRGELPSISVDVFTSENPLCPICEVPIDRVLAEGCKLSHKLPNLDEAAQRQEQRKGDLAREQFRLGENEKERDEVSSLLVPARKSADETRQRLRAAEKARDDRADAWYKSRRLLDDVGRLSNILAAQEQAQSRAEGVLRELEKKRELTGAHRDAQAEVFNRLSVFFDAVISEVVGPSASGKIVLDGTGLRLTVELGGDRSTAAINSLKVIAFDLAVMCMSIEGRTPLPAFFVHDSPREADLGLSVYHRLFHLVRNLEVGADESLFQYIITTTTRPPKELLKKPWLRDTLGGSPAEARLLKRDL